MSSFERGKASDGKQFAKAIWEKKKSQIIEYKANK